MNVWNIQGDFFFQTACRFRTSWLHYHNILKRLSAVHSHTVQALAGGLKKSRCRMCASNIEHPPCSGLVNNEAVRRVKKNNVVRWKELTEVGLILFRGPCQLVGLLKLKKWFKSFSSALVCSMKGAGQSGLDWKMSVEHLRKITTRRHCQKISKTLW